MRNDLLDALLGRPGDDPGCDAVFDQLDRYCEAVRQGENVSLAFPAVVLHLRNCPACREDAEGLLAALALEEERRR